MIAQYEKDIVLQAGTELTGSKMEQLTIWSKYMIVQAMLLTARPCGDTGIIAGTGFMRVI